VIVEYRENKRTLRGAGAKRNYRYTRRILLKCEKCNKEREVNCTPKIQQSQTHYCKSCIVAELGRKNKGKSAWNKGEVRPIADCSIGNVFINSSGYCEVYVGNAFDKKHRRDKYRLLHHLVVQVKNNKYIENHHLVHHIDGDKTNNNPNNLFVCESKAIHQDIHTQLENLSMTLVKSKVIQFDHTTGKYHLPQLEEILTAYSVNSEEIYSLQITKTGDMTILSQADQQSEGATTIPLGSRV
jgi:hypothetical protein